MNEKLKKDEVEQLNMASAIVSADIDWLKINMFDPGVQSQEEICYNYQLFKHV